VGVVSAVLTLLVGFDVISVEDRQRAETMLVTLLPLLLPTVAYILGRVLLKLKG
jgi:hypothetical protein